MACLSAVELLAMDVCLQHSQVHYKGVMHCKTSAYI